MTIRMLFEEIRPEHGHVLVMSRRPLTLWERLMRRTRPEEIYFLAVQNGVGDVTGGIDLGTTLEDSMRMALDLGYRPTHHARMAYHVVYPLPAEVEAIGIAHERATEASTLEGTSLPV
jgi:hypothetical protein